MPLTRIIIAEASLHSDLKQFREFTAMKRGDEQLPFVSLLSDWVSWCPCVR